MIFCGKNIKSRVFLVSHRQGLGKPESGTTAMLILKSFLY
jgi:hypothetical protein